MGLAKKIIGGAVGAAEIGAGIATGNPLLAIQGAGTAAGGFSDSGNQGQGGSGGGDAAKPDTPSTQGANVTPTPPPPPVPQAAGAFGVDYQRPNPQDRFR